MKKLIVILFLACTVGSQVQAVSWDWLPWKIYDRYITKKMLAPIEKKILITKQKVDKLKKEYNVILADAKIELKQYNSVKDNLQLVYDLRRGKGGVSLRLLEIAYKKYGIFTKGARYLGNNLGPRWVELRNKYGTDDYRLMLMYELAADSGRSARKLSDYEEFLGNKKTKIEEAREKLQELYAEKKALLLGK